MPFIEVINTQIHIPHIKISSFGYITLSKSLYRKYFNGKKIQVFHDPDAKKIGLKPSDSGFAYNPSNGQFRCNDLIQIITGTFYPKWNEKFGMLMFNYEETKP